jgi:cobalt-zinc-cadmium resistance protein CzcA
MDEGDILVQIAKSPAISLERSAALDLAVERTIKAQVPEVEHVVARLGSAELEMDPMGLNETDMFLKLRPKAEWRVADKDWLVDELRKVLRGFPGVDIGFTQPIEMRVSEMLTGVRGDVAIKVFGNDLRELAGVAARIEKLLGEIPGAEDVFTAKNEGMQYLRVRIDRLAAGRLGLSVDEIESSRRSVVQGQDAGSLIEAGRRVPILIRADEDFRASAARFADLRLGLDGGGAVSLSAVAHLERVDGPVKIDRENGARYVTVQANVRGRDLVGFVEEARARVAADAPLPAGYRLEWSGQFENQQRAQG